MPTLLLRQESSVSLSTIVEKSQRQPLRPPLEYDLQLRNGQLDLILLTTDVRKNQNTDEGFESDIDSISLISSENESFTVEKPQQNKSKVILTETDSANGGSGTESDTETEKTNTLTQSNVNSIKECFEKHSPQDVTLKTKESYNLLDCLCYNDVNYPDILIFVIKNDTLVFKFDNQRHLQNFYSNFSTVKAIANQRVYSAGKVGTKYNLLQRTDNNGVTHIEITREQSNKDAATVIVPPTKHKVISSNVISINTLENAQKSDNFENKPKDVNLRQRAESKFLNDKKFNTVSSKLGTKKNIFRSSSIENILNIDNSGKLVNRAEEFKSLRKIWNSAEDLLDSDVPKRPERRKKKKPAPLPPQTQPEKQEDVFSGQFVRVNVNFDALKDLNEKRLIIKSSQNEPHPKKLQNFNILSSKNNFTSFLKPNKTTEILKYPEINKKNVETTKNNVTSFSKKNTTKFSLEKNDTNPWTNSVPRLLKTGSRSKSETRNSTFQPMAYRYIDATIDYPPKNNVAFFDTRPKPSPEFFRPPNRNSPESSRLSFAYNNTNSRPQQSLVKPENNFGNRLFGLTPKLKEFSGEQGGTLNKNKWTSVGDLSDKEKNNLKSVIKSNGDNSGKKKNDKKVTFSAYTTVQVV